MIIRTVMLAFSLLAPTLAQAEPLLFPDRAAAYVRAMHPELAHAPLAFTCVGPHHVSYWRSEPEVSGYRDAVAGWTLHDTRCDDPWSHAEGAIARH